MTAKEIKEYVKEMKSFKEEVVSSKATSEDFLKKAGICTPKGTLKKIYTNS